MKQDQHIVYHTLYFTLLLPTLNDNDVQGRKNMTQTCLMALPPGQPKSAGTRSVKNTHHPLSPLSSSL